MVLTVEPEGVVIGGRTYLKSTETPRGFESDVVTHYARRGPDGIYDIHPDLEYPEEYRIMPLPLVSGAKWRVVSPLGDALNCTAVEVGEVQVLGRTYETCIALVCEGLRALGDRCWRGD